MATGAEIRRFEGDTDAVWSVTFSPDGRTAFSGSADGWVFHWDLATGEILHRYTGLVDFPVMKVAVSPDGQYVAEGDYYGGIYVFEVATGKETYRLLKHMDVIDALAFSPDGRMLFSVGKVKDSRFD